MGELIGLPIRGKTFTAIAMCLECKHRWVGIITVKTNLLMLECSQCNSQKSFVSILPKEYTDAVKVE